MKSLRVMFVMIGLAPLALGCADSVQYEGEPEFDVTEDYQDFESDVDNWSGSDDSALLDERDEPADQPLAVPARPAAPDEAFDAGIDLTPDASDRIEREAVDSDETQIDVTSERSQEEAGVEVDNPSVDVEAVENFPAKPAN